MFNTRCRIVMNYFRCDKLQYYQRVTRNGKGLSEVLMIFCGFHLINLSYIRCEGLTLTPMSEMTEGVGIFLDKGVDIWNKLRLSIHICDYKHALEYQLHS